VGRFVKQAGWAALAAAATFLLLALPGLPDRAVICEEIWPYLEQPPRTLESAPDGTVRAMPPYEPGAPAGPRWVASAQWPVLAWDTATRQWPVLVRGHQSALGTYPGLLLGGGVTGARLSTALMAALMVALTVLLAKRLGGNAWVAAAVIGLSFGMLAIGRTGYGFEVSSRLFMVLALLAAAADVPLSPRRALAVGLLAGVAIVCRATIAVTLAPALAVLLWSPRRRSSALVLCAAIAVALPLLCLGAVEALAPLRSGTEPLRGLASRGLADVVPRVPGQLLLQLAWVTDAGTVWSPLTNGALALDSARLALTGGVGLLLLGVMLWRAGRGTAGEGERAFAAAVLCSALAGALFYRSPNQFQLALALDPLLAVAIASWTLPRAGVLAAAAAGLRLVSCAFALRTDIGNPMLSPATQRAAVAKLTELGVRGPELVTTTYAQSGVLEALSPIRPTHAWPLLLEGETPLSERLGAVIAHEKPRYLLLSEGTNLYETRGLDPRAINLALDTALPALHLEARIVAHFPTESGAPGWALVALDVSRDEP
jgi:hypothetical protein